MSKEKPILLSSTVCLNCGRELCTQQVRYYDSMPMSEYNQCIADDDYAKTMIDGGCSGEITCYCGRPKMSDDDYLIMEGGGYSYRYEEKSI